MTKPKTVKSYLKMLIAIAETNMDDLGGFRSLEDYDSLGDVRAEVQNYLGENTELLEKYNLKYDSSTHH